MALARALATDPRLLLLTEPLAALDVSIRAEVRP
jgi:ABC-type sulfate/molybdate transport systems ATPase subunit